MSKKKADEGLIMVSRRIPVAVWQRFRRFCDYHVPRTTDTAILISAMEEYLDRHEPKTKKGKEQ